MTNDSKIKKGYLATVFARGSPEKLMHARIARLSVLFEDLNLEVNGLYNPSLAAVAGARASFGQIYFLRRAVATLREFHSGIDELDTDKDFEQVKADFSPERRRAWNEACRYFRSSDVKGFLLPLRNDVGGHFGMKAALHAIESLSDDEIGEIEITFSPAKPPLAHPLRFHFASLLAGAAMIHHSKEATPRDKVDGLIKGCFEAHRHATAGVAAIAEYLWRRFPCGDTEGDAFQTEGRPRGAGT